MVLPAGGACAFESKDSEFAPDREPAPAGVGSEPEARAGTVTVIGAALRVQNSINNNAFPPSLPQIFSNVKESERWEEKCCTHVAGAWVALSLFAAKFLLDALRPPTIPPTMPPMARATITPMRKRCVRRRPHIRMSPMSQSSPRAQPSLNSSLVLGLSHGSASPIIYMRA